MHRLTRRVLAACVVVAVGACDCDPQPVNDINCDFTARTRAGNQLDLGTANVNQDEREGSVVIENTGNALLRNFTFTFQGNADQYEAVVEDGFEVTPAASGNFLVRFRPTQATVLPTTLQISHARVGDDCPVVSISVTGEGVVPPLLDAGFPDAGPQPDAGPPIDAGFVDVPDGGVLITPNTEWVAYGGFEEARSHFGLIAQADGSMLAIGGTGEDGRALDSIEQFDPIVGRSRIVARMGVARAGPAVARRQDGRIAIVGGSSGSPVGIALRSVELFDPATNAVSCPGPQTACTEADNDTGALPEGRIDAFATASGNDIVVVFGHGQAADGSEPVIDGGVLLTFAAQVTAAPLDGAIASGRSDVGVARADNGDLVLVGGRDSGGFAATSIFRVDASSATLLAIGDLPQARAGAAVGLLANGDAIVVGGVGNNNAVVAPVVTIVNAATTNTAEVQVETVAVEPRARAQLVVLPDDVVVVAGGLPSSDNGLEDDESLVPRSDVEVLVPVGAGWLRLASANDLAIGRVHGQAVRFGEDLDQVLFVGGDALSPRASAHPHAEVYSLPSNRLLSFGLMGDGTALAPAALIDSGAALLSMGGVDPHTGRTSSAVRVFDADNGRFLEMDPLTTPRHGASATSLAPDVILVAGGTDDNGTVLSSLSIYTTTDEVDRPLPVNLRRARTQHTATLLPGESPLGDNIVLLCGGVGAGGEPLDTCELVTPPANPRAPVTFNTAAVELVNTRMATARVGHTATLLETGEVLLLGGGDIENDLVRADVFRPTAGDPNIIVTGQPDKARRGHAAVLIGGGRVLVVGGEVFEGGIGPTRSAELYVRALDTFLPLEDMEVPRAKPAAFLLANGDVLVAGGTRSQSSASYPFASNRESELYVPGADGSGPFEAIDVPLSYGRSDLIFTEVFGRPVVAVGSHRDGVLSSGDERRTPQHMVDMLEDRED
jgi:large repetitive protein